MHGLGDGIAHILKEHLKAREQREEAEAEQAEDVRAGGMSRSRTTAP